MELIRKLRKSIEALVEVGSSVALQHVTEVMLSKIKSFFGRFKFSGNSFGRRKL